MEAHKKILEALLFVSEKPLAPAQLLSVFSEPVTPGQVKGWFKELAQEYAEADRGLSIIELGDGFQMVTDPALAESIQNFNRKVKRFRLSKAALETLAIIVYRQPLTRAEVEQVRGVDASGVLDTLLKFDLVRIAGRKEVPGRPLLYGTTKTFLEHFGLKSLDDLPSLEELQSMPGRTKEVQGIAETEEGAEIVETSDDAAEEDVDAADLETALEASETVAEESEVLEQEVSEPVETAETQEPNANR